MASNKKNNTVPNWNNGEELLNELTKVYKDFISLSNYRDSYTFTTEEIKAFVNHISECQKIVMSGMTHSAYSDILKKGIDIFKVEESDNDILD